MAIKDDYIKIRVSKEQKELFKDIAKKKNLRVQRAWSLELVSLKRNYKRLN